PTLDERIACDDSTNQISRSDLPKFSSPWASLESRAEAHLLSPRSSQMFNKFKKVACLISLPVIAILLTSPTSLNFVEIAEAGDVNGLSESRTNKVSPLMKGNKHRAGETVTVILTLNRTRSGRLK